jgi:hypothetical protein
VLQAGVLGTCAAQQGVGCVDTEVLGAVHLDSNPPAAAAANREQQQQQGHKRVGAATTRQLRKWQ